INGVDGGLRVSTNAGYTPQGAGRHYTVAELVARERAAAERARATQRMPHQVASEQDTEPTRRLAPVGAKAANGSGQLSMHVTELLRREGVGYGEDSEVVPPAPDAPAAKSAATAAPRALAAKTAKDRS